MPAQAVQIWGSYVLVASQNYLLTLDVNNPSDIQPTSFLVPPNTLLPAEELQSDNNYPPPSHGSLWNSPPGMLTKEALLTSSERRRHLLEQYPVPPTNGAQQLDYDGVGSERPATAMALSGRHAYITSWEYARPELLDNEVS